jgi:hypothetical protein
LFVGRPAELLASENPSQFRNLVPAELPGLDQIQELALLAGLESDEMPCLPCRQSRFTLFSQPKRLDV